MPQPLSVAALAFSAIGILMLSAAAMPDGSALPGTAEGMAVPAGSAPADTGMPHNGAAKSYDRTIPGVDRMVLPPGWSIMPEAVWRTPHSTEDPPPGTSWKEIGGGEMPAGWTGAGSLAGSSTPLAPPPRFAPLDTGGEERPARLTLPSAASGR